MLRRPKRSKNEVVAPKEEEVTLCGQEVDWGPLGVMVM